VFVTPAPAFRHQAIIARLTELVLPFALEHRIGRV
jgi:hypothetical protein